MIIIKAIIFGLLGYLLEGIFNRITMGPIIEKALKKPSKAFFTYSSPYMIVIFSVSAILISFVYKIPIMQKITMLPILMLLGAIIIDVIELSNGLLLNKKLDLNIWDYSGSKFNLFGQIDLLHTILWSAITIPICLVDEFIRCLI